MAVAELCSATGCPRRWAWLWVTHKGRPRGLKPGPACRRCRMPLRNSRTLACGFCGQDHAGLAEFDPERWRIPVDPGAKCYPPWA